MFIYIFLRLLRVFMLSEWMGKEIMGLYYVGEVEDQQIPIVLFTLPIQAEPSLFP